MNASYTTELVVDLATICRVNISSDIPIHHTVPKVLEFHKVLLTYLLTDITESRDAIASKKRMVIVQR